MPTSRISAGILAGLGSGIQRGGQAFAMGGQAFEQGRDQAMSLQSQLAQRLAATQLAQQELADKQRAAASQAPEALQRNVLLSNGVPLDAGGDVSQFLQTGKLGAQYDALPADQAGPALPRPGWESKLGGIGRELATIQNAVALGDKSVENVAKANQIARSSRMSDEIQAGQRDATKTAIAEYAIKGNTPYKSDEWGVTDMLKGTVDVSGAPAQGFAQKRQSEIRENDAQAGSARASAASSYASADNSRASASRTRSEMERGIKAGDVVVQQAADGTIMLVNKLNGLARPATMADGVAMAGKMPAPKDASEGERNAAGYADRMIAAESTMGTKAKMPGAQTPGMIERVIGSNNTLSNMAQSSDRQQYRQAQEDWVRAKLRKESGAVIGDDEMAREISVYFPQIGDGEDVIKQKVASRKTAENAMRKSAGRAQVDEAKAPSEPGKVRRFNPATGRIE